MIKIAIAEDNIISSKILQEKLSYFSDVELLSIVDNGQKIVDQISEIPDLQIILMDIEMPILDGIEATRQIKKLDPKLKIIIITIFDDDENIFNAIKAGADSYILKETKAEKIYECITDTLAGGSVMSPSIAVKTLNLLKKSEMQVRVDSDLKDYSLSTRETEILEQLSNGSTNKAISELLFISPFTVKRHVENIYQKLQAHNRIELLEKARKGNLL